MDHIVLLVDDDHNILRGLARALRHQPYQLYTASSGEEALLILRTHDVDVIVTDEQMPGMCGGDLRAWVAENCPEVTRIVLTGRPTVDTAIRAINEGAVYQFFTKPCNPARLGVAIRKALEHKTLLMENQQLLDVSTRQAQQLDLCRRDLEMVTDLVAHTIREPIQRLVRASASPGRQYEDSVGLGPDTLIENALEGVAQVERLVNDLLKWSHREAPESSANTSTSDQDNGGLLSDGSRQSDTVVLSEVDMVTPGKV
jgi:two-component system, probable response regulator PhcQ